VQCFNKLLVLPGFNFQVHLIIYFKINGVHARRLISQTLNSVPHLSSIICKKVSKCFSKGAAYQKSQSAALMLAEKGVPQLLSEQSVGGVWIVQLDRKRAP